MSFWSIIVFPPHPLSDMFAWSRIKTFTFQDSSLVPLWGWNLQMVMDFLGTSLYQVKICTCEKRTEKSRFKCFSGNSARCELATRGVVFLLAFFLVCIYLANIGLSYAEALERQNLNASGMFWHIQTWNIGKGFPFCWHIFICYICFIKCRYFRNVHMIPRSPCLHILDL